MAELDLSVRITDDLVLATPLMAASGTFGFGFEMEKVGGHAGYGALISKGTSVEPRVGNEPPRIAEVPAGMLNAIGLQNPGVEVVAGTYAPRWEEWEVPVVVNIVGDSVEDYVAVVERLESAPNVAGIELNISCPNVGAKGLMFGVDAGLAHAVTAAVRSATARPLIVKLTPNVTDLVSIAQAIVDAGADALSAVNTYVGMTLDLQSGKPVLANVTGGLSGPAIRPLALHAVYTVSRAVSVPVIASGGVMSGDDAVEFLLAGAVAVQVGTLNFLRPDAGRFVLQGIEAHMQRIGVRSVGEIRPAESQPSAQEAVR
ncbi:MAG TPA: dihydroorotate dehydrogenase [Candidatus Dormibacteraeota bacterium]|jgi:dihydroorotate dehydrogenase (NAD+) catalytic subunit|nr:dihydroorotate dehydrogenase [Candidatus Dormibacteraeota bacterium]